MRDAIAEEEFYANSPDTKFTFFYLLATPGGFEFRLHQSGKREIPHLEDGEDLKATYRYPANIRTTGQLLQSITHLACREPEEVPLLERHAVKALDSFRWEPEKQGKGFSN